MEGLKMNSHMGPNRQNRETGKKTKWTGVGHHHQLKKEQESDPSHGNTKQH